MEPGKKLRILIVDDHPLVRLGVRNALAAFSDLEVVAEAANGRQALAVSDTVSVDVALLDLVLPDMDGFDLIKKLAPRFPCVVLTSLQVPEDLWRAMESGAITVLMKNVDGETIADALRAAIRGKAYYEDSAMDLVLRAKKQQTETADPFSDLTSREREVLDLIAQGCTNDEIADRLFLSRKTVKFHVGNLLAKTRVADRTKLAVLYLRREGKHQ